MCSGNFKFKKYTDIAIFSFINIVLKIILIYIEVNVHAVGSNISKIPNNISLIQHDIVT